MESVCKTKIASRGWRFYRKRSWKSPRKGQRLCAEKEDEKIALICDPYAVAWKLKSPRKLLLESVGHVPKELSRAAWFFLERVGKISVNVFDEKYWPSLTAKGGLEIRDSRTNTLERFQKSIGNKYEIADNAGENPIYDRTVINKHCDSFGATPECIGNEKEEDHLINDEDHELICIE